MERKWRIHIKAELEEIEMLWFFWLWFSRVYDFAYDSDLWFSLGCNPAFYDSAYNSDCDSIVSEN